MPHNQHLVLSGQNLSLSPTVTHMDVKINSQLNTETHIEQICKTSTLHLRNGAKLCPKLTLPDAGKLLPAFVSASLGYCNATHY